jgi:Tol biopolymer transport system component
MITNRDPNAIIAAWIDDGPFDLPDTTRRAITTSLPTTQQRRGFGLPWRLPQMSTSLRLILVAAALALTVGGIYLFSGVGGPRIAPAPTTVPPSAVPPTLVPTPIATPAGSPTAADLGLTGHIVFTRYDSPSSMFGKYVGLYAANADGTGERALDVPETDGAFISPDGTQLLLANPFADNKFRPDVANIDGSNVRRLDVPGKFGGMWCSGWSPDGTRLLCKVDSDQSYQTPGVYSLSATDASDFKLLASGSPPSVKGSKSECSGGDVAGDFSPDGTRIVFLRQWCGTGDDPAATSQTAILAVDTTGHGTPNEIVARGLANGAEGAPHWSPDGSQIVFGLADRDLGLVRPDGTGYARIPIDTGAGEHYAFSPEWSPDGTWIMFTLWTAASQRSDLYVVHPDGTDLTRVTKGGSTEDFVSWGVSAP